MHVPSKAERLSVIYERLRTAARTASEEDTLRQLAAIINAVEDEMHGAPYAPANWAEDGRIYPPMHDNRRPVEGRPGLFRYRASKHHVYIGENGAIEIRRLDGTMEVSRPGADNRGVWDL